MLFIFSLLTTLSSIFVALVGANAAPEASRSKVRSLAFLIAGISAIVSISKLVAVIPAGNVGVVETFGNVSNNTLKPGVHLVNPFANIIDFSTRIRDIKETVSTTSQEGLALNMDVSLQYIIDPEKAAEVYQKIGTDEKEILISRFRSIIRQTTSSHDSKAVYTEKRQEIADKIRQDLSKQIAPLGFIVQETLLRDVQLPKTIQDAIQQKLQAEQQSQQMEFVLQKERQEATRKQIEAKGISDFQKIISQGLTPQYLQWKSIEATQKLAESTNSKMVILGSGDGQLPLILQTDSPDINAGR